MSPRTPQQFDEIRSQRKQQIMRTALELFAKQGIQSTSIAMIAKEAAISKGLLYNYFDNKEALLTELIMLGINQLTSLNPQAGQLEATKEQVENYLDLTIEMLESDVTYWKLYFAIVMQPMVLQMVEELIMHALMPVINMFAGYYKSQGYPHPMEQALMIGALLDGISLNYILNPTSFPLQTIKSIIKQKLL